LRAHVCVCVRSCVRVRAYVGACVCRLRMWHVGANKGVGVHVCANAFCGVAFANSLQDHPLRVAVVSMDERRNATLALAAHVSNAAVLLFV